MNTEIIDGRAQKLMAVVYMCLEDLTEAGLISCSEQAVKLTPGGRRQAEQWEQEENFTEEEIRAMIAGMEDVGLVVFR